MLSQQDLKQLAQKGISEQQIETQLGQFKTGFPFLKLEAAAAIGRGIVAPTAAEGKQYVDAWQQYKAAGRRVVKFVPASGAASRMFKDVFAFVDADYDVPTTDFEKKYFDNIEKFAFYDELDAACQKNQGKGIKALMAEGNYKACSRPKDSTTDSCQRACCSSTTTPRDRARPWRSTLWRAPSTPPPTARLTSTSL